MIRQHQTIFLVDHCNDYDDNDDDDDDDDDGDDLILPLHCTGLTTNWTLLLNDLTTLSSLSLLIRGQM